MQGERFKSVRIIDATGLAIALSMVGLFVFLVFVRDDPVARDRRELSGSITDTKSSIIQLRGALDEKTAVVQRRSAELEKTGKLPDRPPVEQDLGTLVALASANDLEVFAVQPLPEAIYPGVREMRFSVQVAGTLPDLMHYFRDVEEAPCWADFGFLAIQRQSNEDAEEMRVTATLTLSLFSAAAEDPTAENG